MPVAAPTHKAAIQQRRLVLVAEDNAINRTVIARQLALVGIACEVCSDGAQALLRWRSGDFALLLTDLHIPRLDGYELTAAIRREEVPGDCVPIIAMTANALRAEKRRCLVAGMDGCLTKPVPLVDLKEMLEAWLDPGRRVLLRNS
jgi:CheY-like chemotaxis protein